MGDRDGMGQVMECARAACPCAPNIHGAAGHARAAEGRPAAGEGDFGRYDFALEGFHAKGDGPEVLMHGQMMEMVLRPRLGETWNTQTKPCI